MRKRRYGIWSAKTGKKITGFGSIRSVVFSPVGKTLAGNVGGKIWIFDLKTKKRIRALER